MAVHHNKIASGVVRCGECVEKMMPGLELCVDKWSFAGMQFSAVPQAFRCYMVSTILAPDGKNMKNCINLCSFVFAAIRKCIQRIVWYCSMQITQSNGKKCMSLKDCLPQPMPSSSVKASVGNPQKGTLHWVNSRNDTQERVNDSLDEWSWYSLVRCLDHFSTVPCWCINCILV